ncbi:MAG TPA: SpoIIIAH-like family protein [Candidatus Faecousia intestinigallinarum]|nr:SpoIIIAH-like family protein [Candidatus Faecousia intestinigallinarum]
MKIWKKNLIAAAILVTVCGGIYLNWLYTEEQAVESLTDTLDADKILSSDMLVMGSGDALTLDNTVTTLDDYFAAVRLSRQEARDSAVSLLQEAMAYQDVDKDSTTNAQLEDIVQTALNEAQIESLVIAKGYADCVAYISEDGISVAVAAPEGGLQQADVAVIADIVMAQSDFTMEDIRVVEVQ